MLSPPCPPSLHCSQPGHGRKDADDPECSYRQTIINYNTNKTILEYLMDWYRVASEGWICKIAQWVKNLLCQPALLSVIPRSHCGRREPVSKSYPLISTCAIYTVSTLTSAYKIMNKKSLNSFKSDLVGCGINRDCTLVSWLPRPE